MQEFIRNYCYEIVVSVEIKPNMLELIKKKQIELFPYSNGT